MESIEYIDSFHITTYEDLCAVFEMNGAIYINELECALFSIYAITAYQRTQDIVMDVRNNNFTDYSFELERIAKLVYNNGR